MYHSTVLSLIKLLSVFFYLIFTFAENSYSSTIDITMHPRWCTVNPDNCGTSLTSRILGGRNASLGQYPWMARLGYVTLINSTGHVRFVCGGSLINQRFVVTAAHCILTAGVGLKLAVVRLGEYNAKTNPDCSGQLCAEPVQDIKPKHTVVHRDFNKTTFQNDIGIIRLDRDAVLNDWVRPICLPHSELLKKDYIGEKAEMIGWGEADLYPDLNQILTVVSLQIIDLNRCATVYKRYKVPVSESQICIEITVKGASCEGDSGGPLMTVEVLNGPPKYFLTGIESAGSKACGYLPGVHTRIASFIVWIMDHLEP